MEVPTSALPLTRVEYRRTRTARWGYWALKHTVAPVIRAVWIGSVEGLENVPPEGPLIVASNHESLMDFLCFASVCPRNVHFLAGERFFERPLWRWLMVSLGQIRLDRHSQNHLEAHRLAASALRQGLVVGIFPGGTRAPDGQRLPAQVGVARLAHWARAPVLPVGISGTFEILHRHRRWPALARRHIRIGVPMVFPEFAEPRLGEDRYRYFTDRIMVRIAALTGKMYVPATPLTDDERA